MTGLPAGWRALPIGDLVDILDSRRIPVNATERAARAGVVPYYGATGRVGWIDRPLFDEPLVLLGEDGVQFFDRDKPKAYGVTGPTWVNNHAHVLRPRSEVLDRRFLIHYLNWFDYAGYANGTTRLKLTQAAMRRITVRCPAIDEQRRIADLLDDHLSRLDAAHSYRQRAIEGAAALRFAFLRDRSDVLRSGGSEERVLGHVADTSLGKMLDANRATGTPTPYLRNINVRWGQIDTSDLAVVPLSEAERQHFALREGDLLVCEGGEPGRCAIWPGSEELLTFQKALHRVRVRPDLATSEFVAAMLELAVRTQGGKGLFTGTTIKHLPQERLRAIRLPVPPIEQQVKLVAELESVDGHARRLRHELLKVKEENAALRRALLDAAFSGKLTSCSLETEIADKLAAAGV